MAITEVVWVVAGAVLVFGSGFACGLLSRIRAVERFVNVVESTEIVRRARPQNPGQRGEMIGGVQYMDDDHDIRIFGEG